MDVFHALAEPTRREIIEILASHGQLSASSISNQFSMSAPAISQHLKILREAHLVEVEKRAQLRLYTINPRKILELESWAHKMSKLWNERFDRLDVFLQKEKLVISKKKLKAKL